MARPAYSIEERDRIEARIRAAAMVLFARAGYRNVSMRAIAGELGWSAPALYRYFPNKESLLAAIRAEGFTELRDILRGIRAQQSAPRARVELALRAYLEFSLTRTDLYRLMYELDQGEIAEETRVAATRSAAFGEAQALARELLGGSGGQGDPNQLAHLFWIGAHGLAALAVANQLDLGQNYDELIEPVLRMILRGAAPTT